MPEKNNKKNLDNDLELVTADDINIDKNTRAEANKQISREIGIVGSANTIGVYSMFTSDALHTLLTQTLKYVFFPATAVISLAQMILTWRQTKLDGMKKDGIAVAVIKTITSLAMITAVIGGFALPAIFSTTGLSSLMFLGAVSASTIYTAGMEIHYLYKYMHAKTSEEKDTLKHKLKSNGISLLTLALGVVATGGVFVGGQYALAVFGIASGAIGGTYTLYEIHNTYKKHADAQLEIDTTLTMSETTNANTLTNNAALMKILLQEKKPDANVAKKHHKHHVKHKDKKRLRDVYTFSENEPYTFSNDEINHTQPMSPQSSPAAHEGANQHHLNAF